ncbi:uncharacterized protein MYCFIDRAFT_133476 [Pseudocercospora fijiensis CIRAD86]|uniref:Probable acetate kinase n=1 Tax=Pseudocercospora fijiensis (strain CIRAD86) TaxID=383855 RepID=M3AJ32_PSEFD|nr:uncharacterized protein MYCFIDRAFT_133476 [Pseudocercospora fijiensis CIRAD86]EME84601.1 hypothetical protein MYCFIDRAFT_133476 [Pseudocercospora fijiensis CIRAD86]
MPKIILAINAGSSSVKVSVFSYESETKDPKQLADIEVSGLTAPPAKLKYTRGELKIKGQEIKEVDSQESAYEYIIKHLTEDEGLPELKHRHDVEFACHRVVHGGDYDKPTRIDRDTYQHLEELSDLAPLHNAGALAIVKAVHANNEKVTNVAFFDSAFHATIAKATRTYAIDQKVAEKNKLRKYGFHGISYQFITRSVAEYLSKPKDKLNIIALHLGSGASACAVKHGQSLDNTMGLTPLAGLPGATRSGDIDPSLIFHFTHDAGRLSSSSSKGMHITQAEQILNKEAGWQSLTGTTDFGVISKNAQEGDETCKLAFDLLVDRILAFVGSYYVKLGGDVDALVFAGGIGEKGAQLRTAVTEGVKCLGFELDAQKNEKPEDVIVADIGSQSSKHRVLVCQTDEQVEMARQCAKQASSLRR